MEKYDWDEEVKKDVEEDKTESDEDTEERQRENDLLNLKEVRVVRGGWVPVRFGGFEVRAVNKEKWMDEEAWRKANEEE